MTGYVPTDVDADVALRALTAEEHTLRARARFFAAECAAAEPDERAVGTEMLICRLHDERYALELALLSAVQPARDLAPLPCTPAFVAGILNVRGTVVTVLDLARGLGLGGATQEANGLVLLTDCAGGGGQGQVGLLVHEVIETRHLALGALVPSLSGDAAIRGLAEAGIVVLDLPTLLGDRRFEVDEEG
ncbi:MAG TPA: chemotaxis protein CheW [Thermomicrobiales bacterium]|jgi:purine-binding chemotaxis protein CheW